MSCKYAVKIGGGGHIFSGCYFMSRINYHLDDTLHWQGIGVYIENKDVAPLVTFNNCYFDSNIYTFWSDSSKVWDLDVNDCRFYYTHEAQFDAEQAYILGGNNVNIRARGCAIFSRPNCDTLLGRMSYSATNNKNFIFEQNKPLNTYIGNVLNVANMGGGLLEFGKDVKKDDLFWVGAISNANLKGGTYKMTIAYGDNYTELIFKNDGPTNKFTLVDAKYGFKAAFFSVFIGQAPKTATGTIETVTYYPIYLFANIAFRGQVKINLEPLSFKPACCYIFNNGWRAPGGAVDDPFIMQLIDTEKPITDTSDFIIENFQVDDTVKLGDINSAMANQCFKIEVGNGGSFAEFVVRKVSNTMTLWDAKRYFNTNFFYIVIDQIPQTVDGVDKYAVYLKAHVANLNGNVRIKITALTPGLWGELYKDGYETGTFTISSPLSLEGYPFPSYLS
jgi:hypothetical protein